MARRDAARRAGHGAPVARSPEVGAGRVAEAVRTSPDGMLGFAVALGCGLLIGIERERRKGQGPRRALAGVRTFTLAALLGALATASTAPALVGAGAALVIALAAIGYFQDRRRGTRDPGVTTELALLLTYLLGVTAMEGPSLAAGAAV